MLILTLTISYFQINALKECHNDLYEEIYLSFTGIDKTSVRVRDKMSLVVRKRAVY